MSSTYDKPPAPKIKWVKNQFPKSEYWSIFLQSLKSNVDSSKKRALQQN